jgi:hypothetical protein
MHRLIISCLAIASFAAMLQADAWNKKTNLTVNESIVVPGATLPPGKYVVKLVDSQANRHIVQFTNETEDQVISTVLAIPNSRMEPTGESEFSFYEAAEGTPPALRAWFYPGDTFGQQFAYPREKAMELSRASGEEVPSLAGDDLASSEVTTISPTERETEIEPTASTAQRTAPPAERPAPSAQPAVPESEPAPRADPSILAQAQQPEPRPRPTPEPAADEADSELPATGGPAPLVGLIGLLSLGGALGLRSLSQRKLE